MRNTAQPINIDALSEAELIDLNHRVVARLKFIREARAHQAMLNFRLGEQVVFYPEGQEPQYGVITKYNRKSVTVITLAGAHWTVAPTLLQRVAESAPRQAGPAQGQGDVTDIEPTAPRSLL